MREDAHPDAVSSLLEDRGECGKIAGLLEDVHAAIAAIHHMIKTSPAAGIERARHGISAACRTAQVPGRQR
jgi:hypothetical protein